MEYKLTQNDIEKIVRKGFAAGDNWACCYKDWFAPTKKDTEKRIKNCLTGVKRSIFKHKV